MARIIPPEAITGAKSAQAKYRIPASVSLAQFILESGNGQQMPPGSNNPFGMKTRVGEHDPYVETTTKEVRNGKTVTETARFRKFSSLTDAFEAHAQLLATAPVYRKTMATLIGQDPADAFADSLTGIYATDPDYGKKLKSIMKSDNLYSYNDYHRIRGLPL